MLNEICTLTSLFKLILFESDSGTLFCNTQVTVSSERISVCLINECKCTKSSLKSEDITCSSSSAWMETGGGEVGDEICLGLVWENEAPTARSSEISGLVSRTHDDRERVLSSGRGLSLFRICPERGDRLDTSIQPARTSCKTDQG